MKPAILSLIILAAMAAALAYPRLRTVRIVRRFATREGATFCVLMESR